MYTAATVTDFNQRVDLGNSYCNCFHLMPRVEKSTWYIFKKRVLLLWYSVCSTPGSTWEYSNLRTLSFSIRLHEIISCGWFPISLETLYTIIKWKGWYIVMYFQTTMVNNKKQFKGGADFLNWDIKYNISKNTTSCISLLIYYMRVFPITRKASLFK